MNMLKNIKVTVVKDAIANASNTDTKSAVLDMQGFDGVMYITPIEDSAATGVATLKAQENSANSTSGSADLTGATATATCAVIDDLNAKALIVDVYRPLKRYNMARLTSATANIAFGPTIAIQYNARTKPTVQDAATILAATLVVSP